MKIFLCKAVTPGQRHHKKIQKNLLCKKNRLVKNLMYNVKRCVGRSSLTGHITVWHRGGGCKKLYRKIKFQNKKTLGVILFSCYDPNRNSFLSLTFDLIKQTFFYTLTTNNLPAGSITACDIKFFNISMGFRTFLYNIPHGALFHSLNVNNSYKTQYARSAGVCCQLIDRSQTSCIIRFPSGKVFSISSQSLATVGTISNKKAKFVVLGKAGRNRLKGFRPHVRGIAMNPVDHPHGGRTNGGCPSVTPWGKPALGQKTAKIKKI